MKKFILITCILVLCFTLAACSTEKLSNKGAKQGEEVTLSIKEKEITTDTKEITLIFENNSDNEYTYGEEPKLEIKKDGAFVEYPIIARIGWNNAKHVLKAKEKAEVKLEIETFYRKLEKGTYRAIKQVSSNGKTSTVSAEFEVK